MQIILASASRRRKELLKSLGLRFRVIPSKVNEKIFMKQTKNPRVIVQEIALAKGLKVIKKIKTKEFLIISADTIVILQNKGKTEILGKPQNRKEAEKMLQLLKNKIHKVFTGVVLIDNQGRQKRFSEATEVSFKNLSNGEIKRYLNTGVYLDRAGAYGIQDEKGDFIKGFKGSYSNILGLPLEKLVPFLKEFGVKVKREISLG